MTRSSRSDFERWLRLNGAEPLGAKQNEFVRFRAQGVLCIVYEPNRRGRQSCDPALAGQAFDAWCGNKAMDLSNPDESETPIEDWHAVGRALVAIGERAKAGAVLDIEHEAAALGIPADRLIRSLRAQRAPVPEQTHG